MPVAITIQRNSKGKLSLVIFPRDDRLRDVSGKKRFDGKLCFDIGDSVRVSNIKLVRYVAYYALKK